MEQSPTEAVVLAQVAPALFLPAGRARFLLLAERRHRRRQDRDRFGIMLDDPPLRPGVASPAHALDTDEIVRAVLSSGGSNHVLVLSEGPEDGLFVDLATAVEEVAGSGFASLVLCVSGPAGYHEGESKRDAHVLRW